MVKLIQMSDERTSETKTILKHRFLGDPANAIDTERLEDNFQVAITI